MRCVAEVIEGVVARFFDTDSVQVEAASLLCGERFERGPEDLLCLDGEVLGGWDKSAVEESINVEMGVIKAGYEFAVDDGVERCPVELVAVVDKRERSRVGVQVFSGSQ